MKITTKVLAVAAVAAALAFVSCSKEKSDLEKAQDALNSLSASSDSDPSAAADELSSALSDTTSAYSDALKDASAAYSDAVKGVSDESSKALESSKADLSNALKGLGF